MKQFSFFIILSSLLLSCSFWKPKRLPSSIESENDLMVILDSLSSGVAGEVSSTKYCHEELSKYYQLFLSLDASIVGLDNFKAEDIEEIIQKSFETRIAMKEKLGLLNELSEDGEKCLVQVKNVMRSLRYMEDYFIELQFAINKEELDPEKFTTLKGQFPYFLVNPELEGNFQSFEDLKSGDVLLSRGNAYSSAAIARIGESDAQFSHLSFVYGDKDGNLHTTEAHIEIGNVVEPIKVHIDQKNARTVVFRYRDSEMSHKASKCIYDRVKYHQKEKKKNIKYDFGMDYKDDKQIFCSEVIYAGFQCASNGEIDIPKYKTKFTLSMIPFLQSLGIDIDENNYQDFDTFGPGDIEYDSRFELVAEWRNPAKMRDSRMKDAILTKIFEWMGTDQFQFHPPYKVRAQSDFAWVARRFTFLPFFKKLKHKFPTNMKSKQMELFIALDMVGEKLQKRLMDKQKDLIYPLSMGEMFKILEEYKAEDKKRFDKKKRKSHWMRYFYAKKPKKKKRKFGPPGKGNR